MNPPTLSQAMDRGRFDDQPPRAPQGMSSRGAIMFHCPGCMFSFTSQVFLHKHLKRNHHDIYRRMLQSGEINHAARAPARLQITTTTSSVTDQMQGDTDEPRSRGRRQQKAHVCTLCNKRFKRLNHLTLHRRIHAGEKPYGCRQCGQRFSALGQLKSHKLLHIVGNSVAGDEDDEAPLFEFFPACSQTPRLPESSQPGIFSCVECPYAFSSAVYLYRHLKCSHSDTYWRMVRSGQIDWAAGQRLSVATTGRLRQYQQFTGALARPVRARQRTPYMCVQCDVCFSNVFDLKDHRRDHRHRTPATIRRR